MILDTGADLTLVPGFALEKLNLLKFSEFKLEGFDGKTTITRGAELQLNFADQKIQGNFPIIEQDYGIIGRNILNRFTIIFDGQNLEWKILQNLK